MEQVVYIVVGAVFLIALGYAIVRAGSVAYFRTKLEYVAKLKQGVEPNGKKH